MALFIDLKVVILCIQNERKPMVNDKKRHFIPALLLLLFLSYQAGLSLFTHTHEVEGITIVHSHPYQGDGHVHTDAQIFAISHLSTFWGEEAAVGGIVSAVFDVVAEIGCESQEVFVSAADRCGINFRAPPYCC